METALPQAAAIWMILLLLVAILVVAMSLPKLVLAAPAGRRTPADEEPASTDDDRDRYAAEIAVATGRAAVTAGRRRTEWEVAQAAVDETWSAFDRADRAARRVAAACAFPLADRRPRPADDADRERWLHHAATAACRNRELTIGQLNEVLAHRGWDARLHPVQQEAVLRTAIRDNRLAAYRAAAERERQAWEASERAASALRSLRAEALAAPLRAGESAEARWWAEQWVTTQPLPVVGPLGSSVEGRHPIAA